MTWLERAIAPAVVILLEKSGTRLEGQDWLPAAGGLEVGVAAREQIRVGVKPAIQRQPV